MKRLSVPLYGLRMFMSNDEVEVRDFVAKHGGPSNEVEGNRGISLCWNGSDDTRYRVMAVFDGTPQICAHEATHMAWEVMSQTGVKVNEDNDEAMAYLVGWLVGAFIKSFTPKDKP